MSMSGAGLNENKQEIRIRELESEQWPKPAGFQEPVEEKQFSFPEQRPIEENQFSIPEQRPVEEKQFSIPEQRPIEENQFSFPEQRPVEEKQFDLPFENTVSELGPQSSVPEKHEEHPQLPGEGEGRKEEKVVDIGPVTVRVLPSQNAGEESKLHE